MPVFSDEAIAIILGLYAIYLIAGGLIAACGLRLAVRLYNRLAGAPIVPKPSWKNSIAICVATTIAGLIAALGLLMAIYSLLPGEGGLVKHYLFTALSLAAAWLIMTGLCCWAIPTTITRSMGVAGIVFAVYVPLVMLGMSWPVI